MIGGFTMAENKATDTAKAEVTEAKKNVKKKNPNE